jgi:hypothetical protein
MIEEMSGRKVLTHSGSTIGFRNFILRVPKGELLVVVLMNRSDGPAEWLARALAAKLLDLDRSKD